MSLEAYISVTQKTVEQICDMIEIEREKRQALLNQNMEALDGVLQRQQAMLMQTENLERKRIALQAAAGFEGLTASEVLEKLPESAEKVELKLIFAQLKDKSELLKELNQTALDIANNNLNIYERVTHDVQEKARGTYRPDGRKGTGKASGASFEEKI